MDLNKLNINKISHSIGNEINNQTDKKFYETVQNYNFAFISFVESLEDRDLKPKEVIEIHELFMRNVIKEVLDEYPELFYYKDIEDKRAKQIISETSD